MSGTPDVAFAPAGRLPASRRGITGSPHDLRELLAAGDDADPAWLFETGPPTTRGELRRMAADWPAPGEQRHKLLVAIVADGSRGALRDLVCALVAGHAVILLPPDAPDLVERVEKAFEPHIIARQADGAWTLERRHHRDLELHPELALMLATSGSTGECKFVRLSYRNLLSNARSIVGYLGLGADERGLMNLPLHYSYGLSIVTSHLLCGAAVLVSSRSVSDPQLWTLFERERCTSLAGVPHSYELLARGGFLQRRLPSLRTMTQAGGRLPQPLARQFARWCRSRGVRFFIMYGQTEASPRIAYLPPQSAIEYAECIGRAVPGGDLWLQDAQGEPIRQPDVEGELVYRGPNVMMGYASTAADLGRQAGPDVLKTGDLAVIDARCGFFRITGRSSRFLKLFGLRISLDELERKLEKAGYEVACTGSDDALGVVTRLPCAEHAALRAAAAQAARVPAHCVVVCGVQAWPRLASGKTDHAALRGLFEEAARAQGAAPAAGAGAHAAEPGRAVESVQHIYERMLGTPVVSTRSSFKDLGGDSLTYVRTSIALQRLLPKLPRDWPALSVAQLQRLAGGQGRSRAPWALEPVETSVLIRAVAPLMVVMYHFGPRTLAGGAALLLMVVGFNISRFMLDHVAADRWGVVLRSLVVRVLLPYWLILLLYGTLRHGVSWPDILLVGNFLRTHESDKPGIETWFVESIAQAMLVLFLVTRFAAVRRGLRARPFATAAGVLGLAVVLRLIEPVAMPGLLVSNEGREFTWTFWLFALGMLVYAGHVSRHRVFASVAIVALSATFYNHDLPRVLTLCVGGLLLVWTDRIMVPRMLVPAVAVVASASLFIYLLHLRAPADTITGQWAVDLVRVVVGLALGIVGWWLYERGVALLRPLLTRLGRPGGAVARVDM